MLLWLLASVMLLVLVPQAHAHALLMFLDATSAEDAAHTIAAWSPPVRASARFVVQFDYLYDLLHDNAVALFGIAAARALASKAAIATARLLGWTMWLDVLLNLVENAAALSMIDGGSTTPWFGVVVATTMFRFATLWLGFAFATATAGLALRDRRRNRSGTI